MTFTWHGLFTTSLKSQWGHSLKLYKYVLLVCGTCHKVEGRQITQEKSGPKKTIRAETLEFNIKLSCSLWLQKNQWPIQLFYLNLYLCTLSAPGPSKGLFLHGGGRAGGPPLTPGFHGLMMGERHTPDNNVDFCVSPGFAVVGLCVWVVGVVSQFAFSIKRKTRRETQHVRGKDKRLRASMMKWPEERWDHFKRD